MGQYKFRVKAFNEVGQSDPLSAEPITAKNPYCKILFTTLSMLKSFTLVLLLDTESFSLSLSLLFFFLTLNSFHLPISL